jgi:hypothetical protein
MNNSLLRDDRKLFRENTTGVFDNKHHLSIRGKVLLLQVHNVEHIELYPFYLTMPTLVEMTIEPIAQRMFFA